ncbi:putative quinol monooxygenase [Frigoribacterium sp. UYMn621]|uniref:putative quinol monooxygenase n=1 Tax=Frigoribacterium sp. UYMn621 TaxID=3156343 RepID=UPI0033908809
MVLILVAHWETQPGPRAEQIAGLLPFLVRDSLNEPGCASYTAHRERDHPNRFVLIESYLDEEALENHRESVHFREMVLGQIVPLLAARHVAFLTHIAGA